MELPFLSTTPAKRPFDAHDGSMPANTANTANGAFKRRPKPPPPPIVLQPGHGAFRLLCPISKIGGVIGKSGAVINVIRQETGAKIRVEDPVPACDERVILIVGPSSRKGSVRDGDGKEIVEGGGDVSSSQEALIRVFDRVLEVDVEEGTATGGLITCRLLVPTGQVGSVMGKGGKVIEKIRKDSGAKIRVLPGEQLPACALPTDEVLQIVGDSAAVKKALLAVSRCLQDSLPSDKPQVVSRPTGAAPHRPFPDARGEPFLHRGPLLPPTPGGYADHAVRGPPVPAPVDRISTLDQNWAQQEVVFRFLCSNDKVGGVIGKGGTIVKALQNESGASISVGSSVAESEERVITVTAMENPESQYSPAQNAVIRVFARSVEAGIEKGLEFGSGKGANICARLLVPSNQIGCLMGKGGTIIAEMRKVTGASIRIMAGDQVPKCAAENDEVVQINGMFENVQDALFHITGKLRDNILPTKQGSGAGGGPYPPTIPETASYGRAREPTSPRIYPSFGLSNNLDRHTTLTHGIDQLGLSRTIDRPPSPKLWASKAVGGPNPRSIPIPKVGRPLPNLRGGIELGSGGKPAIVTNTTMEIVVPEHVIGAVYGENGSNLSRIRQISGAKVVVHDPRPGSREGMVIISGTPDQTHAAQSLLQAFILSGRVSPQDSRAHLL